MELFCSHGGFNCCLFDNGRVSLSCVKCPLSSFGVYGEIMDLEWCFNACDLMIEIFPEDVGEETFVDLSAFG